MDNVEIKVGTKLYLRQRTGNYWVDMVKRPYTVIGVTPTRVTIQEAECVFNGPRYYDSYPDTIRENPNGKVLELKLSKAKKYKGLWIHSSYPGDTYPSFAVFGDWEYEPYLN